MLTDFNGEPTDAAAAARRLMAEAEALARAKGAPAVYLLTGFRKETAQAFYRSIGYGDYALAMRRRLV